MKLGKILKSTTFTLIFTGLLASSALAAGTGDDPTPTKDIPTVKQQQVFSKKLKELQIHKDRVESKYNIMALGDLRTVGVTPFKQETTYWLRACYNEASIKLLKWQFRITILLRPKTRDYERWH
ncbi:hypothetical protein [Paenibacillus xylanexedens]|uniref:hypothetical protein n=1 Tax=Paenibacillus xylanexedens TaxID=528191 RepID=UPI001F0B9465|nr:hypothetical protein [Paenibacillus xylanexedens]